MRDLIERLRAKPEHERKRIAMFSSLGITGLVALVWMSTTLTSGLGTLIASPTNSGTNAKTAENPIQSFGSLLGAVDAAGGSLSSDASVTVEDVKPEPATGPDTRTVIPF